MYKGMIAAASLLALAACDQYRTDGYGSSYYGGPSYRAPAYGYSDRYYGETSRYGAPAVDARAAEGCGSGAPADVLHQNRPGGTDFNPARCRELGY
jgi:hypothetical protein